MKRKLSSSCEDWEVVRTEDGKKVDAETVE
jgi:hypothetical protein